MNELFVTMVVKPSYIKNVSKGMGVKIPVTSLMNDPSISLIHLGNVIFGPHPTLNTALLKGMSNFKTYEVNIGFSNTCDE